MAFLSTIPYWVRLCCRHCVIIVGVFAFSHLEVIARASSWADRIGAIIKVPVAREHPSQRGVGHSALYPANSRTGAGLLEI